jgi:hypothetical protein
MTERPGLSWHDEVSIRAMWVFGLYYKHRKEENKRHVTKKKHGCLALKRAMSHLTILRRPLMLSE